MKKTINSITNLLDALDALPLLPPDYDSYSAKSVDTLVASLRRQIQISEELNHD